MFAASLSRLPEASVHFSCAVEIFRRYWLRAELVRTQTSWARALSQAGEPHASEHYDAALDVLREIDAGVSRIDNLLRERERAAGGLACPVAAEIQPIET